MTQTATSPTTNDDGMATSSAAIFASALVTGVRSLAVAEQQPLDLPLVPTLHQSQRLATAHAETWSDTYAPALLQVLSDIRGYAAGVASFTPDLQAQAGRLAGGDSSALPGVLSGAQHLTTLALAQQQSARAAQSKLVLFMQLSDDDRTRFRSDGADVESRYIGPKGEVVALQTKLASLEDRLHNDNRTIAEGAAAVLPGVVVIGIGVGLAYVDTSVGKVVIEQGLKLTSSEVASAEKARADADEAIAEYKTALTALLAEELQLAVYLTLQGHVEGLADAAEKSWTDLEAASRAWQDEVGHLALWQAVAKGTAVADLPAMIQAYADRWQSLAATADTYLNSLAALEEASN